jgi:hypothetical protein
MKKTWQRRSELGDDAVGLSLASCLQDQVVWVCGSPILRQSLDCVHWRLSLIYIALCERGSVNRMARTPDQDA